MYPHIYISPRSAGRFNDEWPFGADGDLILAESETLIVEAGDWPQVKDFRDVVIPATATLVIVNASTVWSVVGVSRKCEINGTILVRYSDVFSSSGDTVSVQLPDRNGDLTGDIITHTYVQSAGGAGGAGGHGALSSALPGAGGPTANDGCGSGGGGGASGDNIGHTWMPEDGQPGDEGNDTGSGSGGDGGGNTEHFGAAGANMVDGGGDVLSGVYGVITLSEATADNGNTGDSATGGNNPAGAGGGSGGVKGFHGGVLALIVKSPEPVLNSLWVTGASGGNGGAGGNEGDEGGGAGGGGGGGSGGSGGFLYLRAASEFNQFENGGGAGGLGGSAGIGNDAENGSAGAAGASGDYLFRLWRPGPPVMS